MRLRAQRLIDVPAIGVADIVRTVGGIQAQEIAAAELSIWARRGQPSTLSVQPSTALRHPDIDRARQVDRSIVWTWAMRGTLHLVPAEDVRWLVALLGPVFIKSGARRRAELGLDSATGEQAVEAVRRLLAGTGPLVRAEIADRLGAQGIPVAGQAIAHIVALAALRGVICRGPDIGHEPGYVLIDDWLPPERSVTSEVALAELARHYLRAFGPATPADFATWSGLGLTQARSAWQAIGADHPVQGDQPVAPTNAVPTSEFRRPTSEDQPVDPTQNSALRTQDTVQLSTFDFQLSTSVSSSAVRLLPRFDTFLLGYRSRNFTVDPRWASRVNAGGGIIRPTILVDGTIVGTWRTERRAAGTVVVPEPFTKLDVHLRPALEDEVTDLGRFLGVTSSLAWPSHAQGVRGLP